ncbi:MAG: hypothetical protein ACE5JX_12675 [Acidobacteriota bacterium]
MAFYHTISQEEGIAYVTASGPGDLQASEDGAAELAADPSFQSYYGVLVDLRLVEYLPSAEETREIAAQLGQFKDTFDGKVAVVVSGNVAFGLVRMTCIYAELMGCSMTAFRDYQAALQWLKEPLEAHA